MSDDLTKFNKLNYDDYHKFITSIGLSLIVIGLIGTYFILIKFQTEKLPVELVYLIPTSLISFLGLLFVNGGIQKWSKNRDIYDELLNLELNKKRREEQEYNEEKQSSEKINDSRMPGPINKSKPIIVRERESI